MGSKQHVGICFHSGLNKSEFLKHLLNKEKNGILSHFNDKKGTVFSDLAIAAVHEEEHRHDKCLIAERKLASYSSGERKKLFLEHLLKENPDFIILDNPLDHLDIPSREALTITLKSISEKIMLIQLASRAADFLPFIKKNFTLNANSFELIPFSESQKKKRETKKSEKKPLNLPKNGLSTPENDPELVKMDGVSVHYGDRPIVSNINWTIKKGDFWQLTGPNGSGKSTLLSLITGESTKGYGQELYLFGRKKGSGESVWEIKQKTGYFAPNMTELFQRNNTLLEMVLSGFYDSIGLYDAPTTLQQKQALQWLELAGIQELKNKNYNRLSPSQQRLGLILRAVVKNPPLVILDEPTEGLDDTAAQMVINLVNTLRDQGNMAIVFVSHRVEKGLEADAIFELVPSEKGSTGIYKKPKNGQIRVKNGFFNA